MPPVPTAQIPGVYHRRIGDIVVTALSDGYLDGTVEVMQNISPDDATRMLTDRFRGNRSVVIVRGDATALDFEDGRFRGRLKSTGLRPKFLDKLIERGIHVDNELFALEAKVAR